MVAGPNGKSMFSLWESASLPMWLFSWAMSELLLRVLVSTWCCLCADYGHSHRCVVGSHFILQVSDATWRGASLHVITCRLWIFSEPSLRVSCPFLNQVHFHIVECLVYSGEESFSRCVFRKYFLSVCGLSFHSLNLVFQRAEVFNFNKAQLIIYFLHGSHLWCCS